MIRGSRTVASISGEVDANIAHVNSVAPDLATETSLTAAKNALQTIDNCISGNEAQVDLVSLPSGNLDQRGKTASLSTVPASDIPDATYIGDIKFGEAPPVSYNAGANDATTQRVVLSTETLSALENVTSAISQVAGENHVEILDSSGNGITSTSNALDVNVKSLSGAGASTIGEYNVTLTVVDTEYSQALPANCKGIEFVSRGGYPVRFAFTTGKVATPTGVYFTLKSNCSYESPDGLNLSSKTIYFASDNAGDVVEMIAWS